MRFLILALMSTLLAGSELTARLDRILDGVPKNGLAGVAIIDLDTNQRIFARDANKPLSLASTTKALVSAAALTHLGTKFSYRTQVVGLGPVVAGRVPGLGVIGGGDPCLDGHFADDKPSEFFLEWAATLKRQGVVAIDGDLVIDNRMTTGPIRPESYPQDQDNQQRWYSAPASGFAWNDNCIEVRVVPTRVGQAAEVQVRPRSARILVNNQARTIAGKGDKAIYVTRAMDTNTVTVSGSYSQATPWFPLAIQRDPELLAGDELRAVLAEAGITLSGTVRSGAVDRRLGPLFLVHASPLLPAMTVMNQHSQNFYGEQTLRVLGFDRFHEGSITAGAKATKDILEKLIGPLATEITILDGSGLSYGNLGSAGAMAAVMAAMHRSPVGADYRSTLKLKDVGKAKGFVKTGTLAVATCLVGYVDAPSGRKFAFALLFNKGETRDFRWAPATREAIFRTLSDS